MYFAKSQFTSADFSTTLASVVFWHIINPCLYRQNVSYIFWSHVYVQHSEEIYCAELDIYSLSLPQSFG